MANNAMQASCNTAASILYSLHTEGATRLRLGVVPTIGPYLLPDVLDELKTHFPQSQVDIQEDTLQPLLQRLQAGHVDVILGTLPVAYPNLATAWLLQDPFYLVMPSNHQLASKDTVDLADLVGENCLLLESRYQLHHQVLAICEQLNLVPNEDMLVSSLETLRYMIAAGHGVSFLPKMCVEYGINVPGMTVKPMTAQGLFRTVGLIWRTHNIEQVTSQGQAWDLLAGWPEKTQRTEAVATCLAEC